MSLADIEHQVMDLSILRLLGYKKITLVGILLIKGIFYSVPGFFIGILLSYYG